jgi:hypothetical protein
LMLANLITLAQVHRQLKLENRTFVDSRVTQMRPLWLLMIEWQTESPIPIPRSLVVNIGLKT